MNTKTYNVHIPIDIASYIYGFYGYLSSLNRVCKSFNKADDNRKLEKYNYIDTKYPLFMYVDQLDETYINALAIQNQWEDLLLIVYLRQNIRTTRFSLMVAHTFQRKDIAMKVLNIHSVAEIYHSIDSNNIDNTNHTYLWLLMYYGFETGCITMKSIYDSIIDRIYSNEYKYPITDMIGFIHPRMYIDFNHIKNDDIIDIFKNNRYKICISNPKSTTKSYQIRLSEHILEDWDNHNNCDMITDYIIEYIKGKYVIDKNIIDIFNKYKSTGKSLQNLYHPVVHYLNPYGFYGSNVGPEYKTIYNCISSLYKNQ